VNIPAELLNAEQVEFFRDWVIKSNEYRRVHGVGNAAGEPQ